ncbi:MAG: proton-conducting transporter membrane subunit, partial [Candidatus Nanopelagicales bacterium]|nr:proton-conducting transporter membrane subunit [Candidatus Nanopelagicales bacterium]
MSDTATGPTVDAVAAATGVSAWMWLLLAFPAFGAAVLIIGGRRTDKWGHIFATFMPVGSFVVAAAIFFQMWAKPANERPVGIHLWDWLVVGDFQAPFNLQIDQLSMVFVLLITGVGSLIHIYSLGYMKHDPGRRKFFGYMNLFIAAMLLLVLADNYLLLYVGWEGVGLASYLLVGFWEFKPSAAVAAKKAFVANRVGDIGLSLAIM